MKRMTLLLLWILSIAPALDALQAACPQVVPDVLQSMAEVCSDIRRNQVCYGNSYIDTIRFPDAPDVQFGQVGDIAPAAAFQSLRLSPLDPATGSGGVALMKLQANLPDSLPDQNATFILFGDVEMTSAVDPASDASPMQAFYLKTGPGAPGCEETPASGLLVHTPKDAGAFTFAMNGMNLALGSTVYFSVNDDRRLGVAPVEGAARVTSGGTTRTAVAGTRVWIQLNENLLPEDQPATIEPLNQDEIAALPLDLLDDPDFQVPDPLTDDEFADIVQRTENGDPLCGEDWLMDCDSIPWELDGAACALDENGEAVCESPEFEWGDEGFGEDDYADLSFYAESFDEFSDDEYTDDEYTDDEYTDDEYTDDEFSDDEYTDDEYTDDEYTDDEYTDDGYTDDEYTDDEFSDDEPVDE